MATQTHINAATTWIFQVRRGAPGKRVTMAHLLEDGMYGDIPGSMQKACDEAGMEQFAAWHGVRAIATCVSSRTFLNKISYLRSLDGTIPMIFRGPAMKSARVRRILVCGHPERLSGTLEARRGPVSRQDA
ncbi:hypothetical protein [Paraburkholderia gardini]|uniref:hypothetical protein n=1 Tax=Paraburkholderia gardini TaxID=2823469 RepID=UPI001E52DD54|nr:hypothetical protein [Paraburkholderia gardini]